MYFSVIDVRAIENYKIILVFKDKSVKLFDMKSYLEKGIFKELKDENLFRSVVVSFDSIKWLNGADIDPETLYKDSVSCSYVYLKTLFNNSKTKEEQDFYMKLSNLVLQKRQLEVVNESKPFEGEN